MQSIPFAIIGAGPTGLAAAIAYGSGAVIIEKNSEAGKKLLLSGSGQCNFTNKLSNEDFIRACRKAGPFLKRALYAYDSRHFISLLSQAGCPSFTREDGKVFPVSLKAEHVRDALLQKALHNGAEITFNTQVREIRTGKSGFTLKTDKSTLQSHKLLLACGGSSWPQTGSTGDGYTMANALGHIISPIRPALASIELEQYGGLANCAGNTLTDIKAEFITSTGKHKDSGDLLFTHFGLSGPLILNNSHLLTKGDTVRLHLLPEADKLVNAALQSGAGKQLVNALKAIPLPQSLLEAILSLLNIPPATKVSSITRHQRSLFINALQSLDFQVRLVESLHTSMSTAGGVILKEVNSATLESRVIPSLYLAGEVLDYALPTGGFNIQAAFSTGWLAGLSARQ